MEEKPKRTFFKELLDQTTLDEKAFEAVKMAELYVENRKNNLIYIVTKFPLAVGIIGAGNLTLGIVIGLLL
jgi:hypothetical protein